MAHDTVWWYYAAVCWQLMIFFWMAHHQFSFDAVQCWAWWVTSVEEVSQLPLVVVQRVQNTSGVVWVVMCVMQNDHSRERLVMLAAKLWFWPRQHILVEYANLRDIRDKYFTMSSVTDLFKSIDNHAVINFTKETYFITNCNVCYFNFILAF